MRSLPVQPAPAIVYPEDEYSDLCRSGEAAEANVFHPSVSGHSPPVATQPFKPASPGAVTGGGFIKLPGETGIGAVPAVPRPFPDRHAIGAATDAVAGPSRTRGLGTTAATGLATMPAIQYHLQTRGQTVQTWRREPRSRRSTDFTQQNAPRLQEFQRDRQALWSQLRGHGEIWCGWLASGVRTGRITAAISGDFATDRANEIRDRLRDRYDDLFTYDWWRLPPRAEFRAGKLQPVVVVESVSMECGGRLWPLRLGRADLLRLRRQCAGGDDV
ncbi:MAG: hypothetical protein WDN28_14745 [Chthoniobacter sp.]